MKVETGVLLCSALLCSCSPDPPSETLGRLGQTLYGDDVAEAPGRSLPAGAVGVIAASGAIADTSPYICTATVVAPDMLITAAHCFLNASGALPDPTTITGVQFYIPPTGDPAAGGQAEVEVDVQSVFYPHAPQVWTTALKPRDIACVKLAQPIDPAKLPATLPRVYTSPSLLWYYVNPALGKLDDILNTVAVGYGGSQWLTLLDDPVYTRRAGPVALWNFLPFELDEDAGYFMSWSDNVDNGATTIGLGDSGGPLFSLGPDAEFAPATVLGVSATIVDFGQGNKRLYHAPTWENGNGEFLRDTCLPDVDYDGIADQNDNCVPGTHAVCELEPAACTDPDQTDTDGDGAGDKCDNCGAGVPYCDDQPDPEDCANASQNDSLDEDGIGNLCDNCPYDKNESQFDSDEDGVGDVCDTCPGDYNPYPTCTADDQCEGACRRADGQAVGRCARQDDDPDGDGLGDACDFCPNHPNDLISVLSNSNLFSEEDDDAAVLWDICDPVPVFNSRPIVEPFTVPLPGMQPLLDPVGTNGVRDVVVFDAAAAVGSETSAPHASMSGTVGFRHCSCINAAGVVLPEDQCFVGPCLRNPTAYTQPNSLTPWKRVTISQGWQPEGDAATAPPNSIQKSYATELIRTFTGQVSSDPFHHVNPLEDEVPRLGARELFAWHWRDDATAQPPRVQSYTHPVSGELATAGIWWDRGSKSSGQPWAGSRDQSYGARLRQHFSYLTTPLYSVRAKRNFPLFADPCSVIPCNLLLRPWLPRVNPDPTALGTFSDHLPEPAVVVAVDGSLFPTWRSDVAPLDVTSELSVALTSHVSQGARQWATPVETDYRATLRGDLTHAVVLPEPWLGDSHVEEVVAVDGGLALASEQAGSSQPVGSWRPGPRSAALALLTLTERSVYLIGGETPEQSWSGDIWRYGLDTRRWTPERSPTSPTAPRDVRAATYDYTRKAIVVVDVDPDAPGGARGRFLRFPTAGGSDPEILGTCVASYLQPTVALAARDEGELAYLEYGSSSWTVWRVVFNAAGQAVFIGSQTHSGTYWTAPFHTERGVRVPVLGSSPSQRIVAVDEASYTYQGPPVCAAGWAGFQVEMCHHQPSGDTDEMVAAADVLSRLGAGRTLGSCEE